MSELLKRPPSPSLPWPIALEGVYLIAEQERNLRTGGPWLKAYLCPAGKWTCGWGETEGVDASTTFTEQEADERLLKSLVHRVVLVKSVLTQPANENQLAAMVSLHYNIGHAAFAKSTVLRQHNAGNFEAAARAFALWNLYTNPRTGKKEVAPGLVSRRAIEAALYLKPTEDDMPARMPQAVASESNLAASPIAQGGGATAATGAAVVLASVGDQAQQVSGLMGSVKVAADALKDGATSVAGVLGMPPGVLVGLVLVVVGFFIVKWRRQQRLEGWA